MKNKVSARINKQVIAIQKIRENDLKSEKY